MSTQLFFLHAILLCAVNFSIIDSEMSACAKPWNQLLMLMIAPFRWFLNNTANIISWPFKNLELERFYELKCYLTSKKTCLLAFKSRGGQPMIQL